MPLYIYLILLNGGKMYNIYDIWFSRINISNVIKLKLLNKFSTYQIFNLDEKELYYCGLKEKSVVEIKKQEYKKNILKYEKYLENNNIFLLNYKDDDYPEKLKNIPDMPAYIFVKGNKEILDDDSVGIIGSRNCTEIGKNIAFKTAKELGDKNINVISGLAIRNRYLCT